MNTLKKYKKELIDLLISIDDESRMESFLEALLSPKEMEEIVVRLQIIKLLKQGLTQREVAAILKVGIATVTRGARELKKGKFKKID